MSCIECDSRQRYVSRRVATDQRHAEKLAAALAAGDRERAAYWRGRAMQAHANRAARARARLGQDVDPAVKRAALARIAAARAAATDARFARAIEEAATADERDALQRRYRNIVRRRMART